MAGRFFTVDSLPEPAASPMSYARESVREPSKGSARTVGEPPTPLLLLPGELIVIASSDTLLTLLKRR